MVWAGIAAHASVTGYKSNGGMSTGWRVRFNSTGSDGKPRHLKSVPRPATVTTLQIEIEPS
jgi:hypothetical protein